MVFNDKEKQVLKHLVEKELKDMETKEEKIDRLRPNDLNFRAAEEKYEYVLEQILKKLK